MREMKNSGVAWIGEIPTTWELKTIKQLMIERNEKNRDLKIRTILSLSAKEGITLYDGEHHSGNKPREDLSDYKIVRKNDIVANSMNILSGSVGLSKYTGVVSPVYYIYYPRYEDNIEYFHYIFQSFEFQRSLRGLGNGILIKETENGGLNTIRMRIPSKKLGMQEFPICTREEQDRIVAKLDSSAKKVDVLIANQESQIEKLKQYKQSLITEVVTKGLNPDAEMKDSGVEWIGEIPVDWDLVSTKQLYNIESGATPKSDVQDFFDGDIVWITPADYKTEDVFVSEGRRNITKEGLMSCSTTLIPKGCLIFSKRAPIGSIVINTTELCTNQGCLSCIPKTDDNVKFYYYFMSVFTEEYNLLGSGTTFKEISATNFANFKVTRPSKNAQIEIVAYLDTQCTKIDKLIEIKQAKIAKLNEYKKSLIYEYVTGKKEAFI